MPFLLAFGWLELVAFSVFFIMMSIGCSYDRDGKEAAKWWTLLIGVAVVVFWQWSNFTLEGIWLTVQSASFWKPLAYYTLFGLIYSAIEFWLEVLRSRDEMKASWQSYLSSSTFINLVVNGKIVETKTKNAELLKAARAPDATAEEKAAGRKVVYDYSGRGMYSSHNLVVFKTSKDDLTLEPSINKSVLIDDIAAWTMLWPFYAVSLLIGRFLTRLWSVVAQFFIDMSTRMVRVTFSRTFDVE